MNELSKIDINKIYRLLGKKIREKRRLTGKLQKDIASELNISRTSIANIEVGFQKPPIHLLYEICDILNIEISEVLPPIQKLRTTRNIRVHGNPTKHFTKVIDDLMNESENES